MGDELTCPVCRAPGGARQGQVDRRTVLACRGCGHRWASGLDEGTLASLYERDYYASPDDARLCAGHAENAVLWDGVCRTIRRHGQPPRSILDLGCGAGGFLASAARAFPQAAFVAVDRSPHALAFVAARIPRLVARHDAIEAVPEACADVVVCFNTLEHVADPAAAVTGAMRALRGGGLLLAAVPNAGSFSARWRGLRDHWVYLNPTHLQFFTARSLATLLASCGLVSVTRVVELGGGELGRLLQPAQWVLRRLGLSRELRFVATKA